MATITTDEYLDSGTVRTANETWTMNGAVLTIRTDTRYHIGSPAGMTGSLGSCSISNTLGGGILIDGRNIRELWFDSGAGVVPAIGTTITQGGASGYLLGVYSSIDSAPMAVGAAMPTTGFMKFREVTGSFVAGALTGITANATGADKTSWLEVVVEQSRVFGIPRLGYFRVRGAWYEFNDLTTGIANQVLTMPNHGGGAGNPLWPAVWVETAPSSGVFESYPALRTTEFTTTNLGTDERCKFVCTTTTNGNIIIGGNGTDAAGFLPPAGCRIRIPNVIGRQTSSANRALNLPPHATLGTRPDFTTNSSGTVDIDYLIDDWYHLFTSPNNTTIKNSATFDVHSTSNESSLSVLENYVVSTSGVSTSALVTSQNYAGATITDCKFIRGVSTGNGHCVAMSLSSNYSFTRVLSGVIAYARTVNAYAFNLSQCSNISLSNCKAINGTTSFTTSFDSTVTGHDFCDRWNGNTNSTTAITGISTLSSCKNIMIDGFTLGFNGTLTGYFNPYGPVFSSTNSEDITFRNAGTFLSPLSVASDALAPQYIFGDLGGNTNVRAQRLYFTNSRTSTYATINTSKEIKIEHVYGSVGSLQTLAVNATIRSVKATSNSTTGGASVYGSFVFDMFTPDTAGRLWFAMNEPTAQTSDYVTLSLVGANGGFTAAGDLYLPTIGDQLIMETPYFIIGHTGFDAVAPAITGSNTANLTFEYQLDTGSGYGSYQTLNSTNLSAEVIDSSVGFKMRLRITAIAAGATTLRYVRMDTTSSASAQENDLYPLDFVPITLTGLIVGSRVQIYDTTNTVELYNDVATSTSLVVEVPYVDDFTARVRIMYATDTTAKLFIEFSQLCNTSGLTRAIEYEDDEIYIANAVDGFSVAGIAINDTSLLIEAEDGTFTWADIYAYETAWLTTEEGVRDEGRFITAIDQTNYLIEGFKIKNVSSPSLPLIITGGWGRDSVTNLSITLIDTTGGTIFSNPDLVIGVSTGSGLSPEQDAKLSSIDTNSVAIKTKTDNLPDDTTTELNNIKKNTNLIPAAL